MSDAGSGIKTTGVDIAKKANKRQRLTTQWQSNSYDT